MSDDLLNVKNISFSYSPDAEVLKNISFTLKKGEALGILGPNGGGKTTLVKILLGLLSPTQGEIIHNEKFNQTIGYIPQKCDFETQIPITVSEYLRLWSSNPKLNQLLQWVGLGEKEKQLISKLSVGEKQRLLICRALLTSPSFLILDEPFTALDSTGQDQLLKLLLELKNKTALIIVDHNVQLLWKFCHKILCLNKTLHWHDHKEQLTNAVLSSIYHCEFEHLLLHQQFPQPTEHYQCEDTHHEHK